jgi:hypothetical protein
VEHRPLHILDAKYGGLSSEDDIALANINKRKAEIEKKRDAEVKKRKLGKLTELANYRVTTTCNGKENAKPKKNSKKARRMNGGRKRDICP